MIFYNFSMISDMKLGEISIDDTQWSWFGCRSMVAYHYSAVEKSNSTRHDHADCAVGNDEIDNDGGAR